MLKINQFCSINKTNLTFYNLTLMIIDNFFHHLQKAVKTFIRFTTKCFSLDPQKTLKCINDKKLNFITFYCRFIWCFPFHFSLPSPPNHIQMLPWRPRSASCEPFPPCAATRRFPGKYHKSSADVSLHKSCRSHRKFTF